MNKPVYILSQPIQTGKTGLLLEWIKQTKSVGGILTPDVDGKRKLLDIHTQTYFNLQKENHEDGIKIGRFVFDESVMEKANQIIEECIYKDIDWIVIDEIGRLEINEHKGLETTVSKIIEAYKTGDVSAKLLLVIRDYLLNDAILHYQLDDVVVLDKTYFLTPPKTLNGLVLCGGQSVRMGRDKALIVYHQQEQYAHVAEMLKPICNEVFVSCNAKQKNTISKNYQTIEDSATFAQAGPMTGVLSAFERYPNVGLLVVGCDYPFLTKHDIQTLMDARESPFDIVCYQHPESKLDEPLIAIYEKQCAPLLVNYYRQGNTSLRHFIQQVNTKRLLPESIKRIQSIDN